jgi:hypothetical protein
MILRQFKKPLRIGIPVLFGLCLSLSACAMLTPTKPKPIDRFSADWQFCEVAPQAEPMVCLNMADLIKLRKTLNQCEANAEAQSR